MNLNIISLLLASMFRMSFPLFVPSLGELISQRAGVYNVAVEGYMLLGAVSGYVTAVFTGQAWLGLIVGLICGMFLSLIHAFLSITIKANQFISGMALWIFSVGLSSFVYRILKDDIGDLKVVGLKPLQTSFLGEK